MWIGRGIFGTQSHKTIDRFGNHWAVVDTATTIATVQFGLAAVIGHELTSDDNGLSYQMMVGLAHPSLAWLFLEAVADDLNGDISQRDKKLEQIFFSGGYTDQKGKFHHYTDDKTKWQQGNSLNDLKLSLKGFSFAAQVGYGGSKFSRREAADWLRKELG
ncbi:MAG: hypothetical protein JXB07_19415 [Anaerolineae bacterium]|nr:hypothetical protein [Anaerolineae bacterium]